MILKNLLIGKSDIPIISRALDVYATRQKVISGNIANVNTKGYHRKEVVFEEKLNDAIENTLKGYRTNKKHFPIGQHSILDNRPEIIDDPSQDLASGVNNVNIDQEIVDQIKNEIRFMYAARMLRGSFSALRASIFGRPQ